MSIEYLEMPILRVEPTLCFDLFKNVMAKDYSFLPSEFKKIITAYSVTISSVSFSNLYVYEKLNVMIETINTINNKIIVRRLEPVNLKHYAQSVFVIKTIDDIIEKFGRIKIEADEQVIQHFNYRLRLLRFCFVMSLDGLDFGTLLTTAIIHIQGSKKHHSNFSFDVFPN